MHSDPWHPFSIPLSSNMPIVAMTVCNHPPIRTNSRTAYRIKCIVKWFNFIPSFVVPETKHSIGSSSEEPILMIRIKSYTIYWIQDNTAWLFLFVGFEGNDWVKFEQVTIFSQPRDIGTSVHSGDTDGLGPPIECNWLNLWKFTQINRIKYSLGARMHSIHINDKYLLVSRTTS